MTDWVAWFRKQLQTSAEGFIWAFQQIDSSRQYLSPPHEEYMGLWSPARHVWHVSEYERCLALPSMQQWLGGEKPDVLAWNDSDAAREVIQNKNNPDELIASFQEIRDEQITLLSGLATIDWSSQQETIWGQQPLSKVVTKTYQHTFEHGDTLLRMALWWDEFGNNAD